MASSRTGRALIYLVTLLPLAMMVGLYAGTAIANPWVPDEIVRVVEAGGCRVAFVYRPALVVYGFVHMDVLDGAGDLVTRSASHSIDVRDDAHYMAIKADGTAIALYKGDWLMESLVVSDTCRRQA